MKFRVISWIGGLAKKLAPGVYSRDFVITLKRPDMTKIFTVAIAVLLVFVAPLASAQDQDKAAIDKFIANQATREHGEEYPDARKVVTGDLNSDGTPETVVLYTIEGQNGTNNHIQYLGVFKRANGQLVHVTHVEVGGKSSRDVELDSVTNGMINVTTMRFAKNDPACCPTLKGKAWYRLVKGTLQAVRRPR